MKIKDLLSGFLRLIGPTGFSLACYYHLKHGENSGRFRIEDITRDTGISKRSIIEHNKLLKAYGVIALYKKTEDGKKTYYIEPQKKVKDPARSAVRTGAKCAPSSLSIKSNQHVTDHITDQVHDYKRKVLKELTSHPRYDHPRYTERSEKLSAKEFDNVVRLMDAVPVAKMPAYIKWWIKNKSKVFAGFSFGCLAAPNIIEEWEVKVLRRNLTRRAERRDGEKKTTVRKDALTRHYVSTLDPNNLSKEDREILEEAVAKKFAVVKNGKVIVKE